MRGRDEAEELEKHFPCKGVVAINYTCFGQFTILSIVFWYHMSGADDHPIKLPDFTSLVLPKLSMYFSCTLFANVYNKLVFVPGELFQPSIMFVSRAMRLPKS